MFVVLNVLINLFLSNNVAFSIIHDLSETGQSTIVPLTVNFHFRNLQYCYLSHSIRSN